MMIREIDWIEPREEQKRDIFDTCKEIDLLNSIVMSQKSKILCPLSGKDYFFQRIDPPKTILIRASITANTRAPKNPSS